MTTPDRQDTKNEEYRLLREAAEKNPELFEQRFFIEDASLLQTFGITIPHKEKLPLGYLKLWPQDFIVEEVKNDGELCTVDSQNLLSADTPIDFSATTFATLVKCGVSTIEVVEDLVTQLECDTKAIGFAGIKDKDALTAQAISFRKISHQKLKTVSSPYFFLKDVSTGKGSVATADLQGNRFTILVRTDETFFKKENFVIFLDRLKAIGEDGFYNFFYLQRFGTPRLANFDWALSILKGHYQKAVFDVLTYPALRELGFFQKLRGECKKHFGNWGKIKEILAPFPIIFRHELKLVSYLETSPEDYIGALKQIPDQVSLWIYALASRYFNERISRSVQNNEKLPEKLPLFLSFDKNDWLPYEKEMKRDGIFPPPFRNLRPFPLIQMRHREVPTKDHAKILGVEAVDQGLVLSFELSKGQYATTFLSHIFNLVSGKPPEFLLTDICDTKEALSEDSLSETLDYFSPIISSKVVVSEEILSPENI